MSTAFGLFDKSELYLVPLQSAEWRSRHGCDLLASPVPIRSWRSACRLSLRLHDTPRALATATKFLREKRISILMSECCSTYRGSSQFDAICDLAQLPEFDEIRDASRERFPSCMEALIAHLTAEVQSFTRLPSNIFAFDLHALNYVRFVPLSGLNDASFIAQFEQAVAVQHSAGAVRLPEEMTRYISLACGMEPPVLPRYVFITGSTEHRYMRAMFFAHDHDMFRMTVGSRLLAFAGNGAGVLNQLVDALPQDITILSISTYTFSKATDGEHGRLELIGYWHMPDEGRRELEWRRLRDIVQNMVIIDADGAVHRNTFSVTALEPPRAIDPKVYVSFSIAYERTKLDELVNALIANSYEPVFGIEQRRDGDIWFGGRRFGGNITQMAFGRIDGCVAVVSLQVKRDDLKAAASGSQQTYLVPPWLVAEEVYAWSHPRRPLVLRLRDIEVQAAPYDRNVWEATFYGDDARSYSEAVASVIEELNRFAASPAFPAMKAAAREVQFTPRFPPPDLT